jgi:hypothetical protein
MQKTQKFLAAGVRQGGPPPLSKRWRDCDAASGLAKRLECGAFTAAFWRMLRPRT